MLFLITHSSLFQHFCLTHSSRIGASYRTFIKEDLGSFSFPDPTKFSGGKKARVIALANELETSDQKPWKKINDFIFELYGLDEHDATVVNDTVAFSAPYQSARVPAELPPSADELNIFKFYLEGMLQPLFEVVDQKVAVTVLPLGIAEWNPPWRFVSVTMVGDELPDFQKVLQRLMGEANKTGASRIVLHVPNGGLLIGILNQRRLWTRSRARLCSLYIERHHLDVFPIKAA
jgi:hypothetical protein